MCHDHIGTLSQKSPVGVIAMHNIMINLLLYSDEELSHKSVIIRMMFMDVGVAGRNVWVQSPHSSFYAPIWSVTLNSVSRVTLIALNNADLPGTRSAHIMAGYHI